MSGPVGSETWNSSSGLGVERETLGQVVNDNWNFPMVGQRLRPQAEPTTECEQHHKAARCFHRGDVFIAEYRFKNGKWRIDVVNRGRYSVTISQLKLPTDGYADNFFEKLTAWARGL